MDVFLVEDSRAVRDRLKCTVIEKGGEVLGEASTQADAIKGLQMTQPDILVVDLNLAQGSGLQVIREARKIHPLILIIVFTNHASKEYEQICMLEGSDFFIDKSCDYLRFDVLMESLKRIVDRQELRSEG